MVDRLRHFQAQGAGEDIGGGEHHEDGHGVGQDVGMDGVARHGAGEAQARHGDDDRQDEGQDGDDLARGAADEADQS